MKEGYITSIEPGCFDHIPIKLLTHFLYIWELTIQDNKIVRDPSMANDKRHMEYKEYVKAVDAYIEFSKNNKQESTYMEKHEVPKKSPPNPGHERKAAYAKVLSFKDSTILAEALGPDAWATAPVDRELDKIEDRFWVRLAKRVINGPPADLTDDDPWEYAVWYLTKYVETEVYERGLLVGYGDNHED